MLDWFVNWMITGLFISSASYAYLSFRNDGIGASPVGFIIDAILWPLTVIWMSFGIYGDLTSKGDNE